MNPDQQRVKELIERYAEILGVDPLWASAIAMVESSLGEHRISPTNCRGIFQMSSIAMEDLRQLMGDPGDDLTEIVCGLLFLRLLKNRWSTIEEATNHFCDPNDRSFYVNRMLSYMEVFRRAQAPAEIPPPVADSKPAKGWWEKLWG